MTDDDKYEVLEKIGMRASHPTQCFALANHPKAMAPLELFARLRESPTDMYIYQFIQLLPLTLTTRRFSVARKSAT